MKDENSANEVIKAWIARAQRRRVDLRGRAHRIDDTSISVALSDISYDGCCLIAEEIFQTGEPLLVEVTDLGQVEAEVRWVDGKRSGVLFCSDKHVPVPTQFRAMRRRGRK